MEKVKKKEKVKDVVDPSDIFVSILWKQGLATGESIYMTMEDIIQGAPAADPVPQDVRDYTLSLWDSLTFEDLEPYDENLDFLADCFSFYEDFEEYIKNHKCYTVGYVYSRDGARPFCSIDFYVFV